MMDGDVEVLFRLLAPLDLLDGSVKVLFLIGGFKPVKQSAIKTQRSEKNSM
jgi:hypothetical protein